MGIKAKGGSGGTFWCVGGGFPFLCWVALGVFWKDHTVTSCDPLFLPLPLCPEQRLEAPEQVALFNFSSPKRL